MDEERRREEVGLPVGFYAYALGEEPVARDPIRHVDRPQAASVKAEAEAEAR